MIQDSDAQLIESYLKGDEQALRFLYERHIPSVYNFIARLAPSELDIEDIAQESFVKAWKNLKRFDRTRSFKTWIFTIAKNILFDRIKKKQPTVFSRLESDEEGESRIAEIEDVRPLPDELIDRANSEQRLEEMLGQLKPVQRTVVVLHAIEGMTFAEVGEVLGEPMETVKTRYRRALAKLYTQLTQKD